MALLGKSANTEIVINKKNLQPPTEWEGIRLIATFNGGNIQNQEPSINIDEFTFILDAYEELKQRIADGLIFEGVCLDINAVSTLGTLEAFAGMIDLQNNATINDENGSIRAFVKETDNIFTFKERLKAIDYGFLYQEGIIKDNDFVSIDYQVIPFNQAEQAIILSLTLFVLTKSLIDAVQSASDTIATIASSAPIPTTIFSVAYAIASAIINIAYATALLIQVVNVGRDLINTLIPPVRQHKVSSFYLLIEKVCEYLGYGFNTTIDELKKEHFLASNTNTDTYDSKGFLKKANSVKIGIPNIRDYGYRCSEMFDYIEEKYNARFAIVDGKVQCHTELSTYWERDSTYIFPDILEEDYNYNTLDLKSNIFIGFQTDITDKYTISDFKGTNFVVIVDAITVQDEKKKLITNTEEIRFPYALGSRKDDLTPIEEVVADIAGFIDSLVNTVAGLFFISNVSNLRSRIKSKIGLLRVTDNNHNIAKVLYLVDGKIPKNHRELLSAESAWNNGINEKSFISNNYKRQRKTREGVEIPFGFGDFIKLIKNRNFTTQDNKRGAFFKIEWIIGADKAVSDFYIEEIYTKNLKETYIIPE